MNICWGPDYVNLYNDAYLPSMGAKHPCALGRGTRDVVAKVWEFVGPMFDTVVTRGQPFSAPADQLFPLNRNDYLEEVDYAFSVSPLPDDNGNVGGVLTVLLETTERVLEDRRRHLLRDLASRTAGARTEKEVWRVSAETLGENCLSLPFAFLYEYRPSEHQAYLAGASVETGEALRPPVIDCRNENLWRFDPALAKDGVLVELGDRASDVSVPNWTEHPKEACVVPIRLGEYGEALGFFIAGIHPGRAFDDAYRQFVYRITEQITIGLSSARAYEQERQAELERERLRATEERLAEISRLYRELQQSDEELRIQVALLQQLPVSAWTLKPDTMGAAECEAGCVGGGHEGSKFARRARERVVPISELVFEALSLETTRNRPPQKRCFTRSAMTTLPRLDRKMLPGSRGSGIRPWWTCQFSCINRMTVPYGVPRALRPAPADVTARSLARRQWRSG